MSYQKHGSHSSQASTVTVRVSESIRDEYDAIVGDGNRSEAIREHMRETINDHNPSPDRHPLADEPDLRQAYDMLTKLSDPRTGKVPTELAKTKVADELNAPKESVRRNIITRLETRGLIEPAWGHIRIVEI